LIKTRNSNATKLHQCREGKPIFTNHSNGETRKVIKFSHASDEDTKQQLRIQGQDIKLGLAVFCFVYSKNPNGKMNVKMEMKLTTHQCIEGSICLLQNTAEESSNIPR